MHSIDKFLTEVYSEELYQVSESEYDEVIHLAAEDDFIGYEEFSQGVEASFFTEGDVENFAILDGKVHHKPQPPERQRIQGIEI